MLGLDRPTSGTALVNGRPYGGFAEPLREVGALLDPFSMHPGRTGRSHLRVAARTNGIPERGQYQEFVQAGREYIYSFVTRTRATRSASDGCAAPGR